MTAASLPGCQKKLQIIFEQKEVTVMATIDIRIEGCLLIAKVTGDITANELVAVVLEYYPNDVVKDVIWDLTNGSMKAISKDGFSEIAKTTKMVVAGGARRSGKTVFVVDFDREYVLSSIYKVIAEVTGVPVKYNVVMTIEEARNWLETEC
jgi:hypothetical protein